MQIFLFTAACTVVSRYLSNLIRMPLGLVVWVVFNLLIVFFSPGRMPCCLFNFMQNVLCDSAQRKGRGNTLNAVANGRGVREKEDALAGPAEAVV